MSSESSLPNVLFLHPLLMITRTQVGLEHTSSPQLIRISINLRRRASVPFCYLTALSGVYVQRDSLSFNFINGHGTPPQRVAQSDKSFEERSSSYPFSPDNSAGAILYGVIELEPFLRAAPISFLLKYIATPFSGKPPFSVPHPIGHGISLTNPLLESNLGL